MTWRQAVAQMQSQLVGSSGDPESESTAYVTSPDRLPEAAAVDGCVERAVFGELDETGWLAISRYTSMSPPGLAEQLARKRRFNPADPAQRQAIADAVRMTIATGWLNCCPYQALLVPTRSERDIWAAWAPSMRQPLNKVVPRKQASEIHDAGADALVGALKPLGLTRFLGGMKLGHIGYHLVQGGFYLRMLQTEQLSDEEFERAVVIQRDMEDAGSEGRGRWAWEAYPV